MGVIVGSGTTVTGFANAISANWGASMNSQRLYVLGKTDPFLVLKKPTQNLSVTCYSAGPSVDIAQSAGCTAATGFSAGVSPGACGGCGGGGSGVTGTWYVTSYSYNKTDPNIPGQESFSMMNLLKRLFISRAGAMPRRLALVRFASITKPLSVSVMYPSGAFS